MYDDLPARNPEPEVKFLNLDRMNPERPSFDLEGLLPVLSLLLSIISFVISLLAVVLSTRLLFK